MCQRHLAIHDDRYEGQGFRCEGCVCDGGRWSEVGELGDGLFGCQQARAHAGHDVTPWVPLCAYA